MSDPIPARRLTIYLGENDRWQGHSLYMSILEKLRKNGIAGATVTHALAGFGTHRRIRTNTLEISSMDLPIVISVIDIPERIEHALTIVEPMVIEGLITVEDVLIIKHTHRDFHLLPSDMPVSAIMTHEVTSVTPETPVRYVVDLLLGQRFKAVPVVDDQRYVLGIISTTDLLNKAGLPFRLAVSEQLDTNELPTLLSPIQEKTAQEVMTAPAITVRDDEALGYVVRRLLQHGLKRLPVVNSDGYLVGMLSRLDILRAVAGNSPGQVEQSPPTRTGQTVGDVMSSEVPSVHASDDLAEVLQVLIQAAVKRVIVLDSKERPIGIITDGDLVARVEPAARQNVLQILAARLTGADLQNQALPAVRAQDLMSEQVLTVHTDMSIVAAIELMIQEKRKTLVVIDAYGQPIGTVNRQTLLAATVGSLI